MLVVIGAAANLLGWDIRGWFKEPVGHDHARSRSATWSRRSPSRRCRRPPTAYAYYAILKFAFPDGRVRWLEILAAYATSVALNGILPANLGSLVLLIMLTLIIPGLTFAGVLAVYGVQKIFFVVIGAFPYLYLFLTVGGSFDLKFGFVKDHPWAFAIAGDRRRVADRPRSSRMVRPKLAQVVGPGEGGRPDPLPPQALPLAGGAPRS